MNFSSHLRLLVLKVCWLAGLAAAQEVPPPGLKVPDLGQSRQLIVVLADDWDSVKARIILYQRASPNDAWQKFGAAFPGVLGKKGLAWGIGLHGTCQPGDSLKKEGDLRAPAGVFALNNTFGYAAAADLGKFPYQQLRAGLVGVDDPRSLHYNRIVDPSVVVKDWASAEVMRRKDQLYQWGVVVQHNWKPYPGFGSCIFLHVWRDADKGTAGCTAMHPDSLQLLIRWLDQDQHPLLVQLPMPLYSQLKTSWQLP